MPALTIYIPDGTSIVLQPAINSELLTSMPSVVYILAEVYSLPVISMLPLAELMFMPSLAVTLPTLTDGAV